MAHLDVRMGASRYACISGSLNLTGLILISQFCSCILGISRLQDVCSHVVWFIRPSATADVGSKANNLACLGILMLPFAASVNAEQHISQCKEKSMFVPTCLSTKGSKGWWNLDGLVLSCLILLITSFSSHMEQLSRDTALFLSLLCKDGSASWREGLWSGGALHWGGGGWAHSHEAADPCDIGVIMFRYVRIIVCDSLETAGDHWLKSHFGCGQV